MKLSIVLLVCFAVLRAARSAPLPVSVPEPEEDKPVQQVAVFEGEDAHAEILRSESENNGVDKYSFAYDTTNGISRTEEGTLKETEEGSAIVVQGATSWIAPDGRRYEFSFNADETGYHPIFKLAV